jgi:AraC-like DNA-binding protein
MKKLTNIIQNNLSDVKLDIEFIAKELGYSRIGLYRESMRFMGTSISKLIQQIRINRAKELLNQGVYPTSVAEQCGFGSISYFSSSFKKWVGQTPSEFKRNKS